MKRIFRRVGLSASLLAAMALVAAVPAVAHPHPNKGQGPKVIKGNPPKSQGQGPKLITGNPPKTTVIHCKRLAPGARGVMIIKLRKGVVRPVKNNCRGLPPGFVLPQPIAQEIVNLLPRPGLVPGALVPLLPGGVVLPPGLELPPA